jgi:cytochrome subunit of sulfide dehydrogenase
MTRKWRGWMLAAGTLAAAASATAAPPSAAMLANACGGCHGTHGVSAGMSMPSLAGQSKEFFTTAMKKFKSGERPATVMGRLSKGYSDAEIDAMADFFAKQKPAAQSAAVDAALVEKGTAIYDKQCKRCHLDDGHSAEDDTPIVAGQWLKYLQIQMDEFKSGKRKMSDKKAEKMKPLSPEDLNAVAHFYASQK